MEFSPARSALLIRLLHHRWTAPVAAEIARHDGCRFVEIQAALSISPASLRVALEAAFELGLAERNPGYGHPLRPEYVPTAAGAALAGPWRSLWQAAEECGAAEIATRKWTLPVLDAAAAKLGHFSQILGALNGISPRALSRALRDMAEAGLVQRKVEETFPPASLYTLTPPGRFVSRRLTRLGDTLLEVIPFAPPDP